MTLKLSDRPHALLIDDPTYEPQMLKQYSCWRLYLSPDQRYLGRAYVWLTTRHRDLHGIDQLKQNEYGELLRTIIPQYRRALKKLKLYPTLINACWLGNEIGVHSGHGHMHLIPRYFERTPNFQGRDYPDPNPLKNYQPYEKYPMPDDTFALLVNELRALVR